MATATSNNTMTLKVGDRFPDVTLSRFKPNSNETETFSTGDSLKFIENILLRTLPGAFTPTCHGTDLPDLRNNRAYLLDKYNKIIILTTDNIDVSRAWAKDLGLYEYPNIEFWSDPSRVLAENFLDTVDNSGPRGRALDYHRMAFEIRFGKITRKEKEESNKECKVTNANYLLKA